MKKLLLFLAICLLFVDTLAAQHYRKHRVNIKALSATTFELTDVYFKGFKEDIKMFQEMHY